MTQELLTVGVIGKSLKENENRVAIHPEHIKRIPKRLRMKITFEVGYGLKFGMDDKAIATQITFEVGYGLKFGMDDKAIATHTSGRVASREEILNNFDCVLMPKPLAEDLKQVHKGGI